MHEMSIATAVVEQVESAAPPPGAGRIESVHLEVGQLAGVVADSLQFCFELVCAGTALSGAELHTETVPARARCSDCATQWAVGSPPDLCCPGCGGARTELLSGRELRIRSVRWADSPVHADQEG
ncbi:hydrogenase maturation nickel metallochaperone HypA [Kitasatospora sp. NPDC059571]|uniref:hydrogenase maturation nickel metallochaperone HypA n=1 Tax=Kitasatospora sp. NPDC059571 TaxID=3346871 RepID=UPI00368B255F